jgi:hypothetical protein
VLGTGVEKLVNVILRREVTVANEREDLSSKFVLQQ